MTNIDIQNLIMDTLIQWGISVFAIISSVIIIGLAYLIFRYGWNFTKNLFEPGFIYYRRIVLSEITPLSIRKRRIKQGKTAGWFDSMID